MPNDPNVHLDYLKNIIKKTDQTPADLHPVLEEFKRLIETNSRVYMLMCSMFEEVPRKEFYKNDPAGTPRIRDYQHLLQVLGHLLRSAPKFNDTPGKFGLIGLPLNAVLDYPMGTPSGFAAFLDPDINRMIKKMLDAWGEYLKSEDSAKVLNPQVAGSSSWFADEGLKDLISVADVESSGLSFDDMFVCDPRDPCHGFKSWDDFFTRQFREGVRPVAAPNDDNVIVNACESEPFQVARNVKARDQFWMKDQPYSVADMLSHDEYVNEFVGGTVYQAFLSALSYHRWHAPVSGRIVKAYIIPGTYYSEPLFETIANPQESHNIDLASEVTSQGYLAAIATRAVIFIEADNPNIGLVAFLGIGMAEVSTCDITVKAGQRVKKGDQLGMFHFGGSTHCVLFRKGVNLTGFPQPGRGKNVPVNSTLALVKLD